MNNKYKVRIQHPLIRPGLIIETEASERYLADVVDTLMDKVREINRTQSEKPVAKVER